MNKNYFMMAWACEMIQQERLSLLRISFLVAGHTKFSPDLLFLRIALTYNRSDIFTTQELKDIISQYANFTIDKGDLVCDWRESMSNKYSKLPGIRDSHDFLFTKHAATNMLVAKARKFCHSGLFEDAAIHVCTDKDVHDFAIPDQESENYTSLGKLRPLSESKCKNLEQTYRDFVPSNRRLDIL